jgi:hypothetical protein
MSTKTPTTYTLFVQTEAGGEFVATDFTRSKKATVIAEAEKRRGTEKVGVEVRTQTGTAVFFLKKPNKRVVTRFTKPYTLRIDLDETITVKAPEGYEPIHVRPRNGVVVFRNMEAPVDERYAVVTFADELAGVVATTRATNALMKGVKDGKLVTA